MANANASKARSEKSETPAKASKNLLLLAKAIDSKGKYFNKTRALKALREVINESDSKLERSCVAASLAVAIDDEIKAARKRHAREGFILFLDAARMTAIRATYRNEPGIHRTLKKVPGFIAIASLFKPSRVYEAEFQAELKELVENAKAN